MRLNGKVVDKSGWNYTIIDNDIVETESLDIYEKMLYISLKRFANIQTGKAFPGVKRLSEMAGMSHRKAQLVISSLVEKKFIAVDYRGYQTSLYTILPTPAQNAPHAHDAPGGAHGAGEGAHHMHPPHAPHAPELKKDELKKDELKKDKDTVVADAPTLPFEEIINYLNKRANTSFRHSTKKTQNFILALLKEGFTVDDFKKVIDLKTEEWLKNPDMNQYLRPKTLFNGTNFESYLNQKPKGGPPNGSNQKRDGESGPSEWDDIRI